MTSNGGVSISYADIEQVSGAITGLNRFAAPLVPAVGALATDGDLLASAILSPATAAAAEASVLAASAQLGVTIVATEALALVTASVVVTYQAADAALHAAVPVLVATVETAYKGAVNVTLAAGTVALLVPAVATFAVEAVRSGTVSTLADDFAKSVLQSVRDAALRPGGLSPENLFSSTFMDDLGRHWNANFSLAEISPELVTMEQSALGDLNGWGAYPALLSVLIADGHRVGWFDDGTATLVDGAVGANDASRRATAAELTSEQEIGESFTTDAHGNIVPVDVTSLMASANQIDRIGDDDVANIRIIKSVDADGVVRYTVQIPSTQSWARTAGSAPNDLTSDLTVMPYGNNTALSNAVLAAMHKAGITDQPVMLVGFSLGGITAGSIAADPHGFNVQQVVTAGAPIGRMDIPVSTHVVSLEATQDPIAALDGTANPTSAHWQTIHEPGPAKVGEADPVTIANAHDADRYAVMAKNTPSVNDDPAIRQFLGGGGTSTTVHDYQAERNK